MEQYEYYEKFEEYLKQGLPVIPLKQRSKIPVYSGWNNLTDEITIFDFKGNRNVGLVLGQRLPCGNYLHAIDLDLTGEELLENLNYALEVLKIENPVYQTTASGRAHLFIRISEPLQKIKFIIAPKVKNEAGDEIEAGKQIELLGLGQQVVFCPSVVRGHDGVLRQYTLEGNIQEAPIVEASEIYRYYDLLKEKYPNVKQPESVERSYTSKATAVGLEKASMKHKKQSYFLAQDFGVEDVLNKLSLRFIEKGHYFQVYCPFHSEENPSFVVYKENGIALDYHPEAEKNEMSLIELVQRVKGEEAGEFLKKNYGIILKGDKVKADSEAAVVSDSKESEVPSMEAEIKRILSVEGRHILYEKYLGENEEEIEKIILDENNYNLIARTGAGKNYAVIKAVKKLSLKVIFLSPYESTVNQIAAKYEVPGIAGEIPLNDVRDILNRSRIVVSTYDSFSKIRKCLSDLELSYYTLIIDEYHNFVTQVSFRSRAIIEVEKNKFLSRKIITMTGTPEGILSNNFRNIIYEPRKKPRLYNGYEIVKYDDKLVEELLVSHIMKCGVRGKVVVFRNNIDSLRVMKSILLKKGFGENEISILSSMDKEENNFTEITENEKISSETKIILTTSVISDGVNILNEDIESVYLVDIFDLIQLRQFIARFRHGAGTVYDFVRVKTKSEDKNGGPINNPIKEEGCEENNSTFLNWPEFNEQLFYLMEYLKGASTKLEEYLKKFDARKDKITVNLLESLFKDVFYENQFFYLDTFTDSIKINEAKVRLKCLQEIYKIAQWDLCRRKEYLESFGINVDIKITDYYEFADPSDARGNISTENNNAFLKTCELLEIHPKEVVTAYFLFIKRRLGDDEERKYGSLLLNDDNYIKTFFTENRWALKMKSSIKTIERFLKLRYYKLPSDLIFELLGLPTRTFNRFVNRFLIQRTLWLERKHKDLLRYNKLSMDLFDLDILYFITETLKGHEFYRSNPFLTAFKKFLRGRKLKYKNLECKALAEIVRDVYEIKEETVRRRSKGTGKKWTEKRYRIVQEISSEKILLDAGIKTEYPGCFEESFSLWLLDKVADLYGRLTRLKDEEHRVRLQDELSAATQNLNFDFPEEQKLQVGYNPERDYDKMILEIFDLPKAA